MPTLLLLITDITTYFLSFLLAYFIRNNFFPTQIQPLSVYLEIFPVIAITFLIIFSTFGLYKNQSRLTKISETYHVIKANAAIIVILMAASFLSKYDYSRALVLIFFITSTLSLIVSRIVIHTLHKKFTHKNIGINRILLVGSHENIINFENTFSQLKDLGYKVASSISTNQIPKIPELIKAQKINEVYFLDPQIPQETILQTIAASEKTPANFKITSGLFDLFTTRLDLENLEGIPSINLKKSQLSFPHRLIKSLFDLSLALFSLILLSPLWLILVIIIRLDSKGPAIFSHQRIGQNGKPFRLYKFRTMYQGTKAQDYAPTTPNDQRITKVGRFLRRTSLDELPQLINVIKGEMSLVGPRPEMPFIVKNYNDWQKLRLKAKPGITGLWQILGRKDLPLHENLEYDIYYLTNQSFLLDLTILLKTISVVFSGKGAY